MGMCHLVRLGGYGQRAITLLQSVAVRLGAGVQRAYAVLSWYLFVV